MKLTAIAKILACDSKNIPNVDIHWLLTDSRTLSFPYGSIFFALKSARNNGHKYIAELYRQQLRYFVVSEIPPEIENMPDAIFLQVDNTLHALHQLVSCHRSQFQIPIIGITGSNGKTVVKEWLYQLLQKNFRITRSPRSYNSQIGVPLSVWGLDSSTQMGIFEAGISMPNEMDKLQNIIAPSIGVFTNLGDAHQEGFSNMQQKCEEKLQLFTQSDVLIYCSDNELVRALAKKNIPHTHHFDWGKNQLAFVRVLDVMKQEEHTQISLRYRTTEFTVVAPFTDDASIENVMHCVVVMLYLNFTTIEICEKIALLESVEMRLEVKEGVRNCLIINDTYNSDLNSLTIALNFFNQQSTSKKLSRTLILSDILQSGYSSYDLYNAVSALIASNKIDRFIGIGFEISKYKHLFTSKEKYFFSHTDELLKSPLMYDFHNEIILLKGSRSFHFEDILAKLELIAHETTLDVDLNALVHNLNYFRTKLLPDTKTMCMVKAFAYGSGAVEVARTLQHHQVDCLAVAVADEGAELRREDIRLPIVVMNPEKGAFKTIFEYNLEPEIYCFRLLDLFIKAAEKNGLSDYPIHLKIDTGMHRLGFEEKEIPKLIRILQQQKQVKVRSLFSHIAGADSAVFDTFTIQQVDTFKRCVELFSSSFSYHILQHILNSAGCERFSQFQFDMVRIGIGLYGVSAISDNCLETVCTLKTVILQIKDLQAGDTVGYNRNGKIAKNSRIGILPLGYADGFDRKLGNGVGEVFVNGRRAKTIGNVSMDLIAVDLSDINANEGDAVEIFGKNIPIQEIAQKLDTIPYEILTSVSRRVKRVYFMN